MNKLKFFFVGFFLVVTFFSNAQPNWTAIKNNATFNVYDTTYNAPYLQSIQVPGWEDGLFMTRDGKNLYSTYLPLDAFSWFTDLALDPICFNFNPYYREPLLDIDTVTNVFGCPNFMQSDIIISSRADTNIVFNPWSSSNLQTSFSFDGGAHGVLLNSDTFDVFVYTKDGVGTQNVDIMFMKNVPINPIANTAIPILSTASQEDNPHIERLNDTTLILFFDRDRYIYYSLSYDNGNNWNSPTLITNVINDQSPYDVQPHLWNDGTNWWIYFCANNSNGVRCIYKSKQQIANDWNSWGTKQLVIEPNIIIGNYGYIYGVGEPTLSQWGDISFVVVYGNHNLSDSTDVFDCDPWFLPKKGSQITNLKKENETKNSLSVIPNPATSIIEINNLNVTTPCFLQIKNQIGEVVMTVTTNNYKTKLNIEKLNAGMYFIQSNNNQFTKFIKLN